MILSQIAVDTWVQITGLLVATGTFVIAHTIQRKRDRKIARRDVYQKLEFASIDLFRFEADHLELIKPIWEKGTPLPAKGTADHYALMNYVCQILNLFELAIKFRKDKIMPADIFGSWIAWIYQVVHAPGFKPVWQETRWNYLPQLRRIMDGGLEILSEDHQESKREKQFYAFVAEEMNCDIIRQWTENRDEYQNKAVSSTRKSGSLLPAGQNLMISWAQDVSQAPILAALFVREKGKHYISHGELKEGRATRPDRWADNLEEKLKTEFTEACLKPPFDTINIVQAHVNDQLIGFLLIEYDQAPHEPFATVSDIVVDERFRNLHVGERMISWVFDQLKSQNIRTVYAESNISNQIAHGFLEKMDFSPISKVFRKEIR